MRFSYRQYCAGDETSINELYFSVTGRKRSIEQYAWQWLSSPAGPSEIWLIEAELEDESKKLVGHHGVMAEEFSYGGRSIRVGKTENTMVLPEFREKLLYPRFEKIFLSQYEARFHALFSTSGPAPAIRLREAMGYKFKSKWAPLYLGKEPHLSISLLLQRFLNREYADAKIKRILNLDTMRIDGVEIQVIGIDDRCFDFDHFWHKVAPLYGVTPSRTRANLSWRFWTDPYHTHVTVKLSTPHKGTCICIMTCRVFGGVFINDIYTDKPENTFYFINVLYKSLQKVSSICSIETRTTEENVGIFFGIAELSTPWVLALAELISSERLVKKMPRKVTGKGVNIGLSDESAWYVTPFFFEGR